MEQEYVNSVVNAMSSLFRKPVLEGGRAKGTVISVNMPTPHFYRKYAHPFSEGSFLKILW